MNTSIKNHILCVQQKSWGLVSKNRNQTEISVTTDHLFVIISCSCLNLKPALYFKLVCVLQKHNIDQVVFMYAMPCITNWLRVEKFYCFSCFPGDTLSNTINLNPPEMIEFSVIYNKQKYDITFSLDDTVNSLKNEIEKLTGKLNMQVVIQLNS